MSERGGRLIGRALRQSLIAAGLLSLTGAALAAPMAPPSIPIINLDDPDSFRTFDGTGNNLMQPELGAAGESLIRLFPAAYDDGSSMTGADRPNPREISNAIGDQTIDMPSTKGLSAAFWSFGQLLAHDITLVPQSTDPDELANILVAGDDFDGLIDAIPFRRSVFDPATGTDGANPRQQVNEITAFIDASFVYGSDEELASILRANDGTGRLITGPGNMMPTNGQLALDDDPSNDILFVAGDPRANEQLALAAMHTIFMREHNRLADYIRQTQPGLSDDEIFQSARTILAAEMQAITFNEFLPVLLGEEAGPGAYQGYDPTVNPQITNSFATAAFRLGHTLLQEVFLIIPPEGEAFTKPLTACFFAPGCMSEAGLEGTALGLLFQDAQEFDNKFVDAVRNNLITDFGVAFGVDLPALNIQRGRDHGLPGFQEIHAQLLAMGLIGGDLDLPQNVLDVYGDSMIDLFIGGLSQPAYKDALVGEVYHAILSDQFARLRSGDRFWYERDGYLDPQLVGWLNDITLTDLILWNTDMDFLQTYAFYTVDYGLPYAATPNQISTAAYLQGVKDTDVDLFDLYRVALNIGDSASPAAALDQISGTWFTGFTELALGAARLSGQQARFRLHEALKVRRLGTARAAGAVAGASGAEDGLVFWLAGDATFEDIDPTAQSFGYELDHRAVHAGVDLPFFDSNMLAGVMGSYISSGLDADAQGGDGDGQSWQALFYLGGGWERFRFNLSIGYGESDLESSRTIVFADIARTATTEWDADAFTASFSAGYGFDAGEWRITPSIGVDYIDLSEDALEETGADVLDLAISDRSIDSLRLRGEILLSRTFELANGGRMQPYLRGGIAHEFEDDPRLLMVRLSQDLSGTGFAISAPVPAETVGTFGAGLALSLNNLQLYLDYAGELGDRLSRHSITGGLRVWF